MSADSLIYARCPVCNKRVRLRKDGTVGAHGETVDAESVGEFVVHCSGTGRRSPAEAGTTP